MQHALQHIPWKHNVYISSYKRCKVKLSAYHLLRSSWIVLCKLAMLASRADRPSLNATSALVSKVESDRVLISDHTDSTSHWDSVEFSGGPPDWTLSKPCDWTTWVFWWWAEVSAGLSPRWDLTSACSSVSFSWTEASFLRSCAFPSLSAATHSSPECVGSSWPRDIRYWVMQSAGRSAGSRRCWCWSKCCFVSRDTELSPTTGTSVVVWLWRVLKHAEERNGMSLMVNFSEMCYIHNSFTHQYSPTNTHTHTGLPVKVSYLLQSLLGK